MLRKDENRAHKRRWNFNFNRVVKEGLTEEVTFKQGLEGSEGVSQMGMRGGEHSSRGNGQCTGLMADMVWYIPEAASKPTQAAADVGGGVGGAGGPGAEAFLNQEGQ